MGLNREVFRTRHEPRLLFIFFRKRGAGRSHGIRAFLANLDKLPAESPLDAQVAIGHRVIERRSDTDYVPILRMDRQRTAHAAIRADGVGASLARFFPGPRVARVELRFEHERARGAYADAVSAIHARRIGKRNVKFGGNMSGEAAASYADGKRILRVNSAGLDALVTKNAFRVIANIELVIDFSRLG